MQDCEHGTATLARQKSPSEAMREKIRAAFGGMMRSLHAKAGGAHLEVGFLKDDAVQGFIEAHTDALNEGLREASMSARMRERLEKSNYIFSGMKTFHELNEAFPKLIDENGGRKPFERFLNDVRKIDETYNGHYLRAEYNFVTASAEMAGRWERFEEDGDAYNLQYRTAGDSHVREEHASMNGVTLPFSSPFWEHHFPPNGWNCRCSVVQVRKGKFPETDLAEANRRAEESAQKDKKGMFRFNSGKERKSVPDYNPYTISKCRTCPVAKGKGKKTLAKLPENELCKACELIRVCESSRFEVRKIYPNGGRIEKHLLVNERDSDYGKLFEVAEFFASQGKVVRLTPKMTRPPKFVYENIYGSLVGTKYEGKCPDLWIDGQWYEHEGFVSDNPKRAFRNMLNHGLSQSDKLIINYPNLTESYMKRVVRQRIIDGQTISEIWLLNEAGMSRLV